MPVAIKVDEDLPGEIASLLRAAGHDATTVYEQGHCGLPDPMLWNVVQLEQRMLVTADKGWLTPAFILQALTSVSFCFESPANLVWDTSDSRSS